eukprot:4201569-Pyramimonas_sp.AAC.1
MLRGEKVTIRVVPTDTTTFLPLLLCQIPTTTTSVLRQCAARARRLCLSTPRFKLTATASIRAIPVQR